jgi:hypothetical protein
VNTIYTRTLLLLAAFFCTLQGQTLPQRKRVAGNTAAFYPGPASEILVHRKYYLFKLLIIPSLADFTVYVIKLIHN